MEEHSQDEDIEPIHAVEIIKEEMPEVSCLYFNLHSFAFCYSFSLRSVCMKTYSGFYIKGAVQTDSDDDKNSTDPYRALDIDLDK